MELMHRSRQQYKYFYLLAMIYTTIMVAATTVAYKVVQIGPFIATSASVVFPVTFTLGGIISEVYGYEISKKLVFSSIFCGLLFAVIVNSCIYLPSPPNWQGQAAFTTTLGHTLRFAVSGTIGSLVGSYINIFSVTRWKALMKGKYFPLRSFGASTIGEFCLVLITTLLSFLGTLPTNMVFKMFLFAYVSKILYSLLLLWPAAIVAIMLKKSEGIDIFDNEGKIITQEYDYS